MPATVYYLNWDQSNEDCIERDFFASLTLSQGEDVSSVPREWYREIATVQLDDPEVLYKAFQGGVPLDSDAQDSRVEARETFTSMRVRSMSVGDVIEMDGELILVCGIGTKRIEWGDAPNIEFAVSESS